MTVLSRFKRAWAAFLTSPTKGPGQSIGAIGISMHLETKEFEADLDQIKAKLEELQKAQQATEPRLLILSDKLLSANAVANISRAVRAAREAGSPLFIVEPDLRLYQLAGGRYEPVDGSGGPIPAAIVDGTISEERSPQDPTAEGFDAIPPCTAAG